MKAFILTILFTATFIAYVISIMLLIDNAFNGGHSLLTLLGITLVIPILCTMITMFVSDNLA